MIYLSNWLSVNVNIGQGVNNIGSYAVAKVYIYCAMDDDSLTFCFLRFTESPVRLDSYYHHIDSEPTQQHPLPDTATTSGSSQNGSMSGQVSDKDSAVNVDMKKINTVSTRLQLGLVEAKRNVLVNVQLPCLSYSRYCSHT